MRGKLTGIILSMVRASTKSLKAYGDMLIKLYNQT